MVTLAHKFGIPFIVLTDGDKFCKVDGLQRGIGLLEHIIDPFVHNQLKDTYEEGHHRVVHRYLQLAGIYVNEWTLEVTLLEAGLEQELKDVFTELGEELGVQVRAGSDHIDTYLANKTDDNMRGILTSIADARWGKGRFAHRLVKHIQHKAESFTSQEEKSAIVPEYIRIGIKRLVGQVQSERTGI